MVDYSKWDALAAEVSSDDDDRGPPPAYLPGIEKIVKDWGDNPPPMDKHERKKQQTRIEEAKKKADSIDLTTPYGQLLAALTKNIHRTPANSEDTSVETWQKERVAALNEAKVSFKPLVANCLSPEVTASDITALIMERNDVLFDLYLAPIAIHELLQQGASMDSRGLTSGLIPIHICILWEEQGHEIFDAVLAATSRQALLKPSGSGYTALHFAVNRLRQVMAYPPLITDAFHIFRALIAAGVDVQARTDQDLTAVEELNKFLSLGDFSEDGTPGDCSNKEIMEIRIFLQEEEMKMKL